MFWDDYLEATKKGDLAELKRIEQSEPSCVKIFQNKRDDQAQLLAIEHGHLEIYKHFEEIGLVSYKFGIQHNYFERAAEHGRLDMLEHFATRVSKESVLAAIRKDDYSAFRCAAKGHLSVVQYFEAQVSLEECLAMIRAKEYAAFQEAGYKSVDVLSHFVAKLPPEALLLALASNKFKVYTNAAFRGSFDVMNYLEQIAPEHTQALILKHGEALLKTAVRESNIALLNYLKSKMPLEHIKKILSQHPYWVYWEAVRAKNIAVLECIEALVPECVDEMLSNAKYHICINAYSKADVFKHFLAVSSACFKYFEENYLSYQTRIDEFVVEQLEMLRGLCHLEYLHHPQSPCHPREGGDPSLNLDSADAEMVPRLRGDDKEHGDDMEIGDDKGHEAGNECGDGLTINQKQAEICFYIIRNMIRRNYKGFTKDIAFLLQIPAVKALAHTSENELLKMVHQMGNKPVAQLLLAIPDVHKLAEINEYYGRDNPKAAFDLRSLLPQASSNYLTTSAMYSTNTSNSNTNKRVASSTPQTPSKFMRMI